MKVTILPDGDLEITASSEDREGILDIYVAGQGFLGADTDIMGELQDLGYDRVEPEWIGALTDAPILTDGVLLQEDELTPLRRQQGLCLPAPDARLWWFPQYQITDPWEELAREGRVVFQAAPVEIEG